MGKSVQALRNRQETAAGHCSIPALQGKFKSALATPNAMRLYAFTDLHGNTKALAHIKEVVRKERPDVVVCLGDLTVFEHEAKALLSRVNLLRVPVLMLHGNHEAEGRFRKACGEFPRIRFLHKESVTIGGWTFVAFGGGGFEERHPELEAWTKSKELKGIDWERAVFLSHAPPHGTTLDDIGERGEEWHVGSRSLAQLVKKHHPRLLLAGHLHECFHRHDKKGRTAMANPGPLGKLFDLEKLK